MLTVGLNRLLQLQISVLELAKHLRESARLQTWPEWQEFVNSFDVSSNFGQIDLLQEAPETARGVAFSDNWSAQTKQSNRKGQLRVHILMTTLAGLTGIVNLHHDIQITAMYSPRHTGHADLLSSAHEV